MSRSDKEKLPGWSYTDGTDMGADAAFMTPESLAVVRQGKELYQQGFEAGDQEMMDQGHAMAEGERAKYGYSGGANGGGYVQLAFTRKEPDYGAAPSEYKAAMDKAIAALQSRGPFTYDPETDPSYQQYKEQYTRLGQRAMEDSYGHAALRTGGLGGSAAMSASQQAYNGYMQALADKVPELRQVAYQMYQDEEDRLRRDIELYGGLDQRAWDRWSSDRAFQRGAFETDRSFDYGKSVDQWNMARQLDRDAKADEETAYQHQQDQRTWDWQEEARDYQRRADKAAGLAAVGNFSGYADLWGLDEAETETFVAQYAKETKQTEEQAARDLADWYAQYGDFNKLKGLGVNTSALERQQAMALAPKTGGVRKSADDEEVSKYYKTIVKTAGGFEDPGEAMAYLNRMVNDGWLNPEEAATIYQVELGYTLDEDENEVMVAGKYPKRYNEKYPTVSEFAKNGGKTDDRTRKLKEK